ncbi:MAG: MATE family efflux transporter [Acholeplasmataceae bacterium]
MDRKDLFMQKGVFKSIFILGLPLILSQLVNVLYNIVDRIFIGNIAIIGKDALAGVGITFPIIMVVSAFAALVGLGGAPLAGIKLGEDNKEEAKNIMMNSFFMLISVGLILTVFLLIFGKETLYLFGMTDELYHYGRDYLSIYALGSVFVMIALGLSAYITTQGYTKVAALIVLVGAILNIILDPLLIYTFDLGVKGAAIATIVSQGVSACLVVLFLMSKKSSLKLSLKGFKLNNKIILSILALGISPFIMQSTEALIQIVFNTQIVKYGGLDYVIYLNIMTIMLSVIQFIILPIHGLSQGSSPMISYNFGSGNFKRVKETYKALNIISISFTILLYLVIFIFPKPIASVFNQDPQILEKAPKIMRIFFLGMSVFGLQLATQTTFMALGQAFVSLSMAVLRKIVILIPLTFILPIFLGIDGIFLSEMIADFLATIITFTTFMLLINKIIDKRKQQLLYEKTNL